MPIISPDNNIRLKKNPNKPFKAQGVEDKEHRNPQKTSRQSNSDRGRAEIMYRQKADCKTRGMRE